MNKQIRFPINSKEYLSVWLPQPLENVVRFDEITITYTRTNEIPVEFILFKDFIIEGMRSLQTCIKKALLHELSFHESFSRDLGYLWNKQAAEACKKYIKNEIVVWSTVSSDDGTTYWRGWDYHIWGTADTNSWIYEKNNVWYFEITPFYKWHYMPLKEVRKDIHYMSFREFMKQYKPLAITLIERSTLIEWKERVDNIMLLIEHNDT